MADHLKKRARPFQRHTLTYIEELAEAAGSMDQYRNILIYYVTFSRSYAETYDMFRYIRRKLGDFNESQFIELFRVMNQNNQIYNADGCPELVEEVQEIAEETIGRRIDLAVFKNLTDG